MPEANTLGYQGRTVSYQLPLGIYLEGRMAGRVHNPIIPEYYNLSPKALASSNVPILRRILEDATRQLQTIAPQDNPLVRTALRNTIDLTTQMLAKE